MLAVECLIACCGNVVTQHESFGKILGTFQNGTCLRRADDRDVLRAFILLQVIVDTFYQRVFGAHNNHVDIVVDDKLFYGFKVISLHGYILTATARASIARGNKKFLTLAALSNFPCQGVLTAAAT